MICYAREVISDGWPAMREGGGSSVVDARVSAMEESAEQIPVNDPKQAVAFERRSGRVVGEVHRGSSMSMPVQQR